MKKLIALLLCACIAICASAAAFAQDAEKAVAAGRLIRDEEAAKLFSKTTAQLFGIEDEGEELLDGVVDGKDTILMLAKVKDLAEMFKASKIKEVNVLNSLVAAKKLTKAKAEKLADEDKGKIFSEKELLDVLKLLKLDENYQKGEFDAEDFFAWLLILGSAAPWWDKNAKYDPEADLVEDIKLLRLLHGMDKQAPKEEEIKNIFKFSGLDAAFEQSGKSGQ